MPKSFPFLQLPAELRNTIYELALVEQSPIPVDKEVNRLNGFPDEPSLLRLCSSIRNEAIGIWLKSNEFAFTVTDCDADVLNRWAAYCDSFGFGDIKISIILEHTSYFDSWHNLLHWCRAIFQGKGARMVAWNDDMNQYERAVSNAHWITLKTFCRTWQYCEENLKDYAFGSFGIGYRGVFGNLAKFSQDPKRIV